MLMFHYVKRELESWFVHRFSVDTMSYTRLLSNSFVYWIWEGICLGYSLFSPYWTPPSFLPYCVKICLITSFFAFEVLNGLGHLNLRNLRPPGTRVRGIPTGLGYDLVSCAHYFYEIICWSVFAIFVHTMAAYVWLIFTCVVLSDWGMTRHLRYIKEFDGKEGRLLYPPERKALIPFIY